MSRIHASTCGTSQARCLLLSPSLRVRIPPPSPPDSESGQRRSPGTPPQGTGNPLVPRRAPCLLVVVALLLRRQEQVVVRGKEKFAGSLCSVARCGRRGFSQDPEGSYGQR